MRTVAKSFIFGTPFLLSEACELLLKSVSFGASKMELSLVEVSKNLLNLNLAHRPTSEQVKEVCFDLLLNLMG